MENPKAVNAFFLTVVALCLLAALFLSIVSRNVFVILDYLGYLILFFLALAAGGMIIGLITFPLMWLLSRWGGPKPREGK